MPAGVMNTVGVDTPRKGFSTAMGENHTIGTPRRVSNFGNARRTRGPASPLKTASAAAKASHWDTSRFASVTAWTISAKTITTTALRIADSAPNRHLTASSHRNQRGARTTVNGCGCPEMTNGLTGAPIDLVGSLGLV